MKAVAHSLSALLWTGMMSCRLPAQRYSFSSTETDAWPYPIAGWYKSVTMLFYTNKFNCVGTLSKHIGQLQISNEIFDEVNYQL